MTKNETSRKQTPSSLRPRKAQWFAGGVISLAVLGAGAGTAFASTGTPSSHAASHASVGMTHRAEHAKGGTTGSDTTSATPGGTVARDHSSACNLAGTTALSGNWTHGAYVRAAKAANPANVRAAAQSPCGKPTSAHGA